jgi:hypothetical protein
MTYQSFVKVMRYNLSNVVKITRLTCNTVSLTFVKIYDTFNSVINLWLIFHL